MLNMGYRSAMCIKSLTQPCVRLSMRLPRMPATKSATTRLGVSHERDECMSRIVTASPTKKIIIGWIPIDRAAPVLSTVKNMSAPIP